MGGGAQCSRAWALSAHIHSYIQDTQHLHTYTYTSRALAYIPPHTPYAQHLHTQAKRVRQASLLTSSCTTHDLPALMAACSSATVAGSVPGPCKNLQAGQYGGRGGGFQAKCERRTTDAGGSPPPYASSYCQMTTQAPSYTSPCSYHLSCPSSLPPAAVARSPEPPAALSSHHLPAYTSTPAVT